MAMPMSLALNIVAGLVLGATHCMLAPGCGSDFAEQSAAAALRALGLEAAEVQRISSLPLEPVQLSPEGLLAEVMRLEPPDK